MNTPIERFIWRKGSVIVREPKQPKQTPKKDDPPRRLEPPK